MRGKRFDRIELAQPIGASDARQASANNHDIVLVVVARHVGASDSRMREKLSDELVFFFDPEWIRWSNG